MGHSVGIILKLGILDTQQSTHYHQNIRPQSPPQHRMATWQQYHPTPNPGSLPPKVALLKRAQHEVARRRKRKRQLEADVAAERAAGVLGDDARVPDLVHAENRARDAEAEGDDGGDARWQVLGRVVVLRPIV